MLTDRLGDFLKAKRGDSSLRDFAYSLGISHTYLDSLEKGVNPKTGTKVSVSAETIKKIADYFGVTTDYLLGRVDSPTDSLVPTTTEPFDPSVERIGYTEPSPAAQKIASELESDPALLEFWKELSRRDDLQLLFRQTKSMTPETIRKVMRIIKAIEDEEVRED